MIANIKASSKFSTSKFLSLESYYKNENKKEKNF